MEIFYNIICDKTGWRELCLNKTSQIYEILKKYNRYETLYRFIKETIDWKKISPTNYVVLGFEYPYFDKDYLSVYYDYQARKFAESNRFCLRIHFFHKRDSKKSSGDSTERAREIIDLKRADLFSDGFKYCGCLVCRECDNGLTIGRTYLSPDIVNINQKPVEIITSNYSCSIAGKRCACDAVPFSMQEGDYDVCAQVAIWCVVRHFGNSYRAHADTTMGDVVIKAPRSSGNSLKSNGLNIVQVSDILTSYSHNPIVVRAKDHSEVETVFSNELVTYIESGMPFVGFLSRKEHAVAVFGHKSPEIKLLESEYFRKQARVVWTHSVLNKTTKYVKRYRLPFIDYASLVDGLVVNDDNHSPYRVVVSKSEMPVLGRRDFNHLDYSLHYIDAAVVPFHSSINFGYSDVLNAVKDFLFKCFCSFTHVEPVHNKAFNYEMFGFCGEVRNDNIEDKVFRVFLASSNTFKEWYCRYYEENSHLMPEKDAVRFESILYSNLPKFIWCVEFSSVDELKNSKVSSLIIMDSTAGTSNPNPWLIVHGPKMTVIKQPDGKYASWLFPPLDVLFPKFLGNYSSYS